MVYDPFVPGIGIPLLVTSTELNLVILPDTCSLDGADGADGTGDDVEGLYMNAIFPVRSSSTREIIFPTFSCPLVSPSDRSVFFRMTRLRTIGFPLNLYEMVIIPSESFCFEGDILRILPVARADFEIGDDILRTFPGDLGFIITYTASPTTYLVLERSSYVRTDLSNQYLMP